MIPGYRSNAAFGRMEEFELDGNGLCNASEGAGGWRNSQLYNADGPWELGDDDEVLGVSNSELRTATREEIAQDAAS